jgi:hypothetical protein
MKRLKKHTTSNRPKRMTQEQVRDYWATVALHKKYRKQRAAQEKQRPEDQRKAEARRSSWYSSIGYIYNELNDMLKREFADPALRGVLQAHIWRAVDAARQKYDERRRLQHLTNDDRQQIEQQIAEVRKLKELTSNLENQLASADLDWGLSNSSLTCEVGYHLTELEEALRRLPR